MSLPYASSQALPPYCALLIVDAKDFTGNPSIQHSAMAAEIPALVEEAFRRCDGSEIWDQRWMLGHTGDGIALGFNPEHLPRLIHPLLVTLQHTLAERNRKATRDDALIRLRVSLHVGPISASDAGEFEAGNGKPRNDAHRLLDSAPVKAILAASSARTTHVAAILSERVFEDAVLSGYTGRDPDHFLPVRATVAGKSFVENAWLYVPEPSGSLLRTDILGERVMQDVTQRTDAERSPSASRVSMRVDTNSGQMFGVVHGGVHNADRR
jgi:hypothetical protein